MRSFFIGKEKIIRVLYKALTVLIVIFWSVIAFFSAYIFVLTKYVYPLEYKSEICYYADLYDIDRALTFAVIKTESGFNKEATSNKGAKGLMQITDSTGEYIAQRKCVEVYDLYDAECNIDFGCYYIKYLINQFKEQETALIAYNAGEGRVREWLKDKRYSKDGEKLIKIPYKETREYIEKIKQNFSKYKKLYGNILDKR